MVFHLETAQTSVNQTGFLSLLTESSTESFWTDSQNWFCFMSEPAKSLVHLLISKMILETKIKSDFLCSSLENCLELDYPAVFKTMFKQTAFIWHR